MTTANALGEKGTWAVGGKDMTTRTIGYNEEKGAWAVLSGDRVLSWHGTEGAALLEALAASPAWETTPERDALIDHMLASQYYWVSALRALEHGRLDDMQELADQARGAELAASPDGALLDAIFSMPLADEHAVEAGVRIHPADAREAKVAVLARLAELEELE